MGKFFKKLFGSSNDRALKRLQAAVEPSHVAEEPLAKFSLEELKAQTGKFRTRLEEGAPLDEIIKHIPMRRLGKPEEVAKLVTFLAGEAAGYITGAVISINGGLACQ